LFHPSAHPPSLHSFPTDALPIYMIWGKYSVMNALVGCDAAFGPGGGAPLCPSGSNIGDGHLLTQVATVGSTYLFSPTFLYDGLRSEEHTSELQSRSDLVCRLLLE